MESSLPQDDIHTYEVLSVCPISTAEGKARLSNYILKAGLFGGSIVEICRMLAAQPSITNRTGILELLILEENWCSPHFFHMALLILIKNTPSLITQSHLEALVKTKEQAIDYACLFEELAKVNLKSAKFYLEPSFHQELLSQPRNFRVLRETVRKIRLLNKHLISIDFLTLLLDLSNENLNYFYQGMMILKTSKNHIKAFFDEQALLLFLSQPEKGNYYALIARGLAETPELLTFENIQKLFSTSLSYHSSRLIELIWQELVRLNKDLATQYSFDMILYHQKDAKELLEVLSCLSFHDSGPLSPEIWDFLLEESCNIHHVIEIARFLKNYELTLPGNLLESVILSMYLRLICFEINFFIEENLAEFLTAKDFEVLTRINSLPSNYFFTIECFYGSSPSLLTDDLREFIAENIDSCINLPTIVKILSYQNPTLLCIETLTYFSQNEEKVLIFKNFFLIEHPYQRYHLTSAILNQWFESADPVAFLQELKMARSHTPTLNLNTSQNTHTASIHASASESASRLFTRYHSKIEPETALESCYEKIQRWGSRLDKKSKKTVIECSEYVKSNPMVDTASGVGLKQVVALGWLAVSDAKNRLTDLRTAKKRYFEGLYDMWHGYGPSKKICDGGMFNKEIESLVGVHPDATQLMITKEQATAKLGIVAKEELINFIKRHERSIALHLIAQLEEADSLSSVWDNIEPAISERIFDEFGELFPEGKQSTEFENLIKWGMEINVDFESLKKELQTTSLIFSKSSEFSINPITRPHTSRFG